MMLKSMGVNIDAPAIEKMVNDFQQNAPTFVKELKATVEEMDARLKRIEQMVEYMHDTAYEKSEGK